MTNRAKWALLGGLMLAWLALGWTQIVSQPPPQRVPLTHKTGRVAAPTAIGSLVAGQGKRTGAGPLSFTPPKNVFAPLDAQAEVASTKRPAARRFHAKQVETALSVPPTALPTAALPPSAEELAAQQARRQLAQYRFLGYLMQQGVRQAFLGKGQELYVVRLGEIVDGRVLITAMDAASVTLMETGTNLKTAIPLAKDSDAAGSSVRPNDSSEGRPADNLVAPAAPVTPGPPPESTPAAVGTPQAKS